MRRLILALGLILAALAPAAAQGYVLNGKYIQTCALANSKQVDPLVSPGAPMSDHAHDEMGAVSWGASTRTAEQLNGGTRCILHANHSAYWVPSFRAADGSLVHATSFSAYYGAFGKDTRGIAGGVVNPYPNGWRVLAGNPKSAVIQSTSFMRWRCNSSSNVYATPPVTCAGPIQGEINFPSCWDGWQLDSPDHRSHTSGPATVVGTDGTMVRGCPASHPVAVPEIQAAFTYPRPAVGWEGSFLDSDHGVGPRTRTWHADVIEAWEPIAQAELTKCINDPARYKAAGVSPPASAQPSGSPLCGVFTFNSPATPNHWLQTLDEWLSKGPLYIDSTEGWWVHPPAGL